MKPIIKFHTLIISITTALIFWGWINLTCLIVKHPYYSVPIAGFVSIGIYRMLVLIIGSILQKWRWFKKQFFGAYYFEGTWVGFFEGNNKKITFFIETFEQELDSIIIRGEAYRADGGYYGNWITEAINFNAKKGTLSYTYNTDAIKNSFINPGIANFIVKRKSHYKPPYQLKGFSSDLFNPNKLIALEEKISNRTDFITDEALAKAKELHKANESYFLTPEN